MSTTPDTQWRDVKTTPPPISDYRDDKPYVIAVDSKNRMSIGYAQSRSYGFGWVFAKPIGIPTHWTPLPPPPQRF